MISGEDFKKAAKEQLGIISLEQYNEISDKVKIVFGGDALTYTDHGDLIYVYFIETGHDLDSSSNLINNDKVIYLGKDYKKVLEKLEKILRMKKLKRLL